MKSDLRKFYGVCESAQKRMFRHGDAEAVARHFRRTQDTNHIAYRCLSCGFAHVGSLEGRRRPRATQTRSAPRRTRRSGPSTSQPQD